MLTNDNQSLTLQRRCQPNRDFVAVSRAIFIGYPQLSDGAKVTYCVIYGHDWYDSKRGSRKGYAYPTTGRLACLRGSTERTIQRHLNELINAGLVTRLIRQGKASVLFIEEPAKKETQLIPHNHETGGDISVAARVTIMSPQQEHEEKQEKAVNGVEDVVMEETRSSTGGLKPIARLLQSRVVFQTRSRRSWLTEHILERTRDHHSTGCYRTIAERCSQDVVFEALSLLDEAVRTGGIRRSRGALFVGIVRRLCRERGLADPLRAGASTRPNVITSVPPGYTNQTSTGPPRSKKWFNLAGIM